MSFRYPGSVLSATAAVPTIDAASGLWTLEQQMRAQGSITWPIAGQYVDDLFSTFTYTGNGSTQTITNGIDLAGKGGLLWIKNRNSTFDQTLIDTARGAGKILRSSGTGAQLTGYGQTFSSTGFALDADANYNGNTNTYASWTFRKAARFFDVVTWTGDGTSNRTISHSLGVTPGMLVIKRTDTTGQWITYHRSLTNTNLFLESTAAAAANSNGAPWTASTFTLVNADYAVNTNTATYVAYLFAHDTTTDGLIQCGSYTGTGGANSINLGFEPQFLMVKASSSARPWMLLDTMRGWVNSNGADDKALVANTSGAELSYYACHPTATGFAMTGSDGDSDFNANAVTYIYLAIRRPNKPPTTGTQVYNAVARTGTGAAATVTGVGFAPDVMAIAARANSYKTFWIDRLRGPSAKIDSSSTSAETSSAEITSIDQDGYSVTGTVTNYRPNDNTITYINWFFKRAVGVFDEVCYTGDNTYSGKSHGLGVPPEFLIQKARGTTGDWHAGIPRKRGYLNLTNATDDPGALSWTSTTFQPWIDSTGVNFVCYLFATKAGISKVGSYTGNGSSQTINCGFSTGARFVLIKRTDSTGDWYVWDSARGIVAGNDPHLSLNTTAAEVTTDDSVDTDSTGFVVNQLAATNVNVNTATYIYLAFA